MSSQYHRIIHRLGHNCGRWSWRRADMCHLHLPLQWLNLRNSPILNVWFMVMVLANDHTYTKGSTTAWGKWRGRPPVFNGLYLIGATVRWNTSTRGRVTARLRRRARAADWSTHPGKWARLVMQSSFLLSFECKTQTDWLTVIFWPSSRMIILVRYCYDSIGRDAVQQSLPDKW